MRSARSVTTLAACAASILALTVASLGLPALAQEQPPAARRGRCGAPMRPSRARSARQPAVGKRRGGRQRRHRLQLRPDAAHAPADGDLGHAADPGKPAPAGAGSPALADRRARPDAGAASGREAQKITIISTDKEVDEQIEDIAKGNNMTAEQLKQSAAGPGRRRRHLESPDPRRQQLAGLDPAAATARACGSAKTRSRPSSAVRPKPPASRSTRSAKCSSTPCASAAWSRPERRQATGHPDAAGRALPGRGPPVLGLADRGQRRRRRLGQPRRNAGRGRRRAGATASRPAVGPDPGADGVYIIYLRDKRSGAKTALVDLKQVAVALPKDATQAQIDAATKLLTDLKPKITSCETLEATAGKVDGVVAGDLGEAEITDLAPAFQEAANSLKVGQVSDPIRTDAGLHLIAVCGKRQSRRPRADPRSDRKPPARPTACADLQTLSARPAQLGDHRDPVKTTRPRPERRRSGRHRAGDHRQGLGGPARRGADLHGGGRRPVAGLGRRRGEGPRRHRPSRGDQRVRRGPAGPRHPPAGPGGLRPALQRLRAAGDPLDRDRGGPGPVGRGGRPGHRPDRQGAALRRRLRLPGPHRVPGRADPCERAPGAARPGHDAGRPRPARHPGDDPHAAVGRCPPPCPSRRSSTAAW
jgi:peptidyl-prolyl cis-trans isomerase SurA